jgi:hypothetical protein
LGWIIFIWKTNEGHNNVDAASVLETSSTAATGMESPSSSWMEQKQIKQSEIGQECKGEISQEFKVEVC